MDSEDAKKLFAEILAQKESIEAVIGAELDWREMPNNKASRVRLFRPVDPYDENDWPQQFAWLQDNLEKFDQVFRPVLSNFTGSS